MEQEALTKEHVAKRIEELSKSMPYATITDSGFGKYLDLTKFDEKEVTEYLEDFVPHSTTCWLCEEHLWVDYAIVHGESYCTNCGINSRTDHYLTDKDGERHRIHLVLQYHPGHFSVAEEEDE